MRFLAESRELAKAVAHVVRVFGKDSSPMRLIARDATIMVQGVGLETWSQATVSGQVLEPGVVVIPGWVTNQIMGALPAGEMTVQTNELMCQFIIDGAVLRVRKLRDADAPDFPDQDSQVFPVDGDQFATMAAFAAACSAIKGDKVDAMFSCTHLIASGGKLTAEATNRYKIGRYVMDAAGAPDGQWVVPTDWLAGNSKGVTGLALSDRSVRMVSLVDGVQYEDGSRIIDAQYPRLQPLLNEPATVRLQLQRASLQSALKMLQATYMGSEPLSLLMTVSDEQAVLSLPGEQTSGEQRLSVTAEELVDGQWVPLARRLVFSFDPLLAAPALEFTSDTVTHWSLTGSGALMKSKFAYEDAPERITLFINKVML